VKPELILMMSYGVKIALC